MGARIVWRYPCPACSAVFTVARAPVILRAADTFPRLPPDTAAIPLMAAQAAVMVEAMVAVRVVTRGGTTLITLIRRPVVMEAPTALAPDSAGRVLAARVESAAWAVVMVATAEGTEEAMALPAMADKASATRRSADIRRKRLLRLVRWAQVSRRHPPLR